MIRIMKGALSVSLMLPAIIANANDFPTSERVEYVMNCLQHLGDASLNNLQTCSCRIDSIATAIPFEDYSYAVTYNRNRRMTGEAGGIFRDNEAGKQFAKQLSSAEKEAQAQCKPVVHIVAPSSQKQ